MDKGLTGYGINPVVHSLIIDGVLPVWAACCRSCPSSSRCFFFLSILEDTGYMARVAFVMDRLLRKIGLSGRSFVPMLIGFGCTVPAIMATRTVSSDRDRKMTILLTPYMSCSAKSPFMRCFQQRFSGSRSAGDDWPICDGYCAGYPAGAGAEGYGFSEGSRSPS